MKKCSVKPQQNLSNNSLLRSTLTGLVLCSSSVAVQAANYEKPVKPSYVLTLVSHGEKGSSTENSQKDRRADLSMKTKVKTGTKTEQVETTKHVKVKVSEALNRSIKLNDGGVVWVSKTPAPSKPKLSISSNANVSMKGATFAEPVSFEIKSNYGNFIDSWELMVFEADDERQEKPLAVFTGLSLESNHTVKWNGSTSTASVLKSGDSLNYVLKVRDAKGRVDETKLGTLNVVSATNQITKAKIQESGLSRQTILVQGTQVRIFGSDIAKGNTIEINKEEMTVKDGKFLLETILPHGKHNFDVAITDSNKKSYHKQLNVDLEGNQMFMIALADVTVGEGKVTGNLQSLSATDAHLDGDLFVDGRLAFYLKGKIQGKYLITAQMDTGTDAIENLFDNIHKKDPQSLFRRLDPDKYYTVYGDDSKITDDTNSQGKMYVRVDWDKSQALWGNFNTGITGTELSSFNRGLYGAKLSHKSTDVTANGDHKTDIVVFGSEAQSAFRHNQFLGTGGSLYYLKDTDIVDGSEKIWLEVRAPGSERALQKVEMEEGRDYQIDDFQGRIILNRPLLQIVKQSGSSLIKDTPLDGDNLYLMVDYEYVPSVFDDDNKASYGTRGKAWLGDHVALGGTYVHESRTADDYELKGIDLTLQKSRGTYIKVEAAETKSSQTEGSFISTDGGLEFTPFTDNASSSKMGRAYSVEARANLKDFSDLNGSIGAWVKQRGAGFSTSRSDNGVHTIEKGIEALINLNAKMKAVAKLNVIDKKANKVDKEASLQFDYKSNNKLTLSVEGKQHKEDDLVDNTKDGKGTLAAFKVGYDLNQDANIYVIAQSTIKKEGTYDDNNLYTIGGKAKVNDKLELSAEVSSGDRGTATTLGANYELNDGHQVYTNVTRSEDKMDAGKTAITVGQRKSVSDQLSVFTEHQFTKDNNSTGSGHTFGVDYDVNKAVTATASVQTSKIDSTSGLKDRNTFSVGLNYKEGKTSANTRLEYRRDKGTGTDTEQWVTTNTLKQQINPALRLQGKFNLSTTKDKLGNTKDASFTEASIGFALRPVSNDRLNVLGRLTYLYDLQPLTQSSRPDEKSVTASLESTYQLAKKWEIGGKLAHKTGKVRTNRGTGSWDSNDVSLAAARVRYHLTNKWDAMAEYHWMNSKESQDTLHGALVSVDRHIGKNMKVGIGYNFTSFNDDLSNTDGTAKGWFINLVGKF